MDAADWPTMITVGRIVRPQGNKGHVVVASETDFAADRFAPESVVFALRDGRVDQFRVRESRMHAGRWVVGFDASPTMNDAEALRDVELRIPADWLQQLDVGQHDAHDLVGCRVETVGGEFVGVVERVDFGSGVPTLVVTGVRAEVLVPLAEDICRRVDPGSRLIVIDPPDGLIDLNAPGANRGGAG